MPEFVQEREAGSVTVLELTGRITAGAGSEPLDQKLQNLISAGRVQLLLDCSRVVAIDSLGISALVRAFISTRNRGGSMKLMRLSKRVRKVLEVNRLNTVIGCFDDEPEALASFQPHPS